MYNLFLEFDNDGNVENVYSIEVFFITTLIFTPNVIRPSDFKPNGIKPSDHLSSGAGTFRHQPFGRQKFQGHFGDKNVAQMSRRLNGQICSHTPSALNAGAKRSGATCLIAMPQCCYLAKGAKRPIHTTNMLTSSNMSVN